MAPLKRFMVAFSTFSLTAMVPTVASSEGFIDLYSGAAYTQNADVSVKEFAPFFTPANVRRTVDFDTSIAFGGRIGYWGERVPWLGLALDVSSFRAEGRGVDIDLIPLSPLLLLRWPMLTGTDFPKGRLQPYVGVGPGIFIIPNFEVDFRPAVAKKVSEWQIEKGLDARAGLAWQLHKHFAVFAEYRFTHVSIEFEERRQTPCVSFAECLNPFRPEARSGTAETTLDTHHLLVGISFRF